MKRPSWPEWGGPNAPTTTCRVAALCEQCGAWTSLMYREGKIICREREWCEMRSSRWPNRRSPVGLDDFLESLRRS